MEINGWGRYPKVDAQIDELVDRAGLSAILKQSAGDAQMIIRGAGRSYGDSSLANRIVSSRFLDNFIEFDTEHGLLACASGATLEQVLEICVPKGWLLPVLPGTRFVTVGGAIASDVHGKNHHRDGCFSNFVQSITLMLASGEVITCDRTTNSQLFEATCGGMGLTGIILDAKLKLEKITSAWIEQHTYIAANLGEILTTLKNIPAASIQSPGLIAWRKAHAEGAQFFLPVSRLSMAGLKNGKDQPSQHRRHFLLP